MDNKDQKKCYCARCFLPIGAEDKVDIEGQNFHSLCSMCCICRTIPTSLKMFYGHVFCSECFKTHVLSRFRGEPPQMHCDSWWMQWAPGTKQESSNSDNKDESQTSDRTSVPEEPERKRFICSRCLHAVDETEKVEIGGQCFHCQCARCYFCHAVPTENLKIYYGQVFCEECFHNHVLSRNNNPNEFFKTCFEQWQNNAQVYQDKSSSFMNVRGVDSELNDRENMRTFMGSSKDNTPFVFMMGQPPFCRDGAGNEWAAHNDARKSASPDSASIADETSTWDLSFENRTEFSDIPESCNAIEDLDQSAAEKIEKLTKYLQEGNRKKWKNFVEPDKISVVSEVSLVETRKASLACPKCLWQCGPIYVNSELLKRDVCCGDVLE